MTKGVRIRNSIEFSRLIEALSNDVANANIHFQLYSDLGQAYDKYPLARQQSSTFWYLTENAHIAASLACLCRVYDQHGSALHLYSWLSTIKSNLHLFDVAEFQVRLKDNPFVGSLVQSVGKPDSNVLEEDIRLSSKHDPLVKTLMAHRGNRIAHVNADNIVAQYDINLAFPLPDADYLALLKRAKEILNRYTYLFEAATYTTQMVGHNDFDFILKSVQENVERARAASEKFLKSFNQEKGPEQT